MKKDEKIKYNISVSNLMNISGVRKLNKLYSEIYSENAIEFIDELFYHTGVQYIVSDKELRNIPKTGAFIAVANHPFGALDGLVLLKLFLQNRNDFKLFPNDYLENLKPLSPHLVNGESTIKKIKSLELVTNAQELIKNNGCVGLFPSRESLFTSIMPGINADKKWDSTLVQFIKDANVPILPVYIKGTAGLMVDLLKVFSPQFTAANLSAELFSSKSKEIKVRIGKPIYKTEQEQFNSIERFSRYLRARTLSMGSALEVKKFFVPQFNVPHKPEEIIPEAPKEIILEEIASLHAEKIASQQNMDIYCTSSSKIPNILNEIGRLREITFRAVGEGTNKSCDLDEYDLYYNHLFIWDTEAQSLVGSYRIGRGDEIFDKYGKKGFYISSLFEINSGFIPYMRQSIELGRSFILKEYQMKPLPLYLLWRGILFFLLQNPQYRYLMGPVSISNHYSKLSKSLIVSFIKKFYFDEELAKFITPKKKFTPDLKKFGAESMLEIQDSDIKKIDKIISDIEPSNFAMPVLIKKYLSLNAKILAFNIDPLFNDALDGLLLLDLNNVPQDIITRMKEDMKL